MRALQIVKARVALESDPAYASLANLPLALESGIWRYEQKPRQYPAADGTGSVEWSLWRDEKQQYPRYNIRCFCTTTAGNSFFWNQFEQRVENFRYPITNFAFLAHFSRVAATFDGVPGAGWRITKKSDWKE